LFTRQNCDNVQSFSLILLLVGDMGNSSNFLLNSENVRDKQKALAECIERQQKAFKIHESTINFQTMPQHGNELLENSIEIKSQKLKLLFGDILLSESLQQIAELK
jgi:hypothetical protein